MRFEAELIPGLLIRRYQRFLADVELDDGREVTVHCPNTGAMLGCDHPGSRVWLRHYPNPARKYPLGWELVETREGTLVGINTAATNRIVLEALEDGRIQELRHYRQIQREVKVDGGRLDFRLCAEGLPACLMEVKNVTAAVRSGTALFPDAASERATRHVQTLARLATEGHRAVLLFCVQREDVDWVEPAADIDPLYARTVRESQAAGVEILAYRCEVSPQAIVLRHSVGFRHADCTA